MLIIKLKSTKLDWTKSKAIFLDILIDIIRLMLSENNFSVVFFQVG